MLKKDYTVRAVHCDHTADDEAVYVALQHATAPLERSWKRLQSANRIVRKINQDALTDSIAHFAGHRQYLSRDFPDDFGPTTAVGRFHESIAILGIDQRIRRHPKPRGGI